MSEKEIVKNSASQYISKCCGVEVTKGGNGDTHYYVCSKCLFACDVKMNVSSVNASLGKKGGKAAGGGRR